MIDDLKTIRKKQAHMLGRNLTKKGQYRMNFKVLTLLPLAILLTGPKGPLIKVTSTIEIQSSFYIQ